MELLNNIITILFIIIVVALGVFHISKIKTNKDKSEKLNESTSDSSLPIESPEVGDELVAVKTNPKPKSKGKYTPKKSK